jgi:hypothetical protein
MKNELETIKVNEKFVGIDIKPLDTKKRINLGEKILKTMGSKNINEFQVYLGAEGDILLKPMVSIPAKEAWIYKTPEALSKIKKGLKEARDGKTKKVKSLDNFLKAL